MTDAPLMTSKELAEPPYCSITGCRARWKYRHRSCDTEVLPSRRPNPIALYPYQPPATDRCSILGIVLWAVAAFGIWTLVFLAGYMYGSHHG